MGCTREKSSEIQTIHRKCVSPEVINIRTNAVMTMSRGPHPQDIVRNPENSPQGYKS